jgi:succinoglycan biosynthesis transport protein ExoP
MIAAVTPEQPLAVEEWRLQDFLDILKRRKIAFVQVFLLVLAMGSLAATRGKPIYQTSAKLLVPVSTGSVSVVDANNPIGTMLAAALPDSLSTQLEVLQSAPFLSEAFRIASIVPNASVVPPAVRVEAREGTNVIQITVEGGDPRAIAKLANTIVDLHLERTDLLTTTGLRDTIKFVQKEKEKVARDLTGIDQRLLLFRKAHPGMALSTEREARAGEYAALRARVLEVESNLATTREQLVSLRVRLQKEPVELVQETANENPLHAKLQGKLEDLRFQRMDLERDFRPASRPMRDLDQQIARVQQRLAAEPKEIILRAHVPNPRRLPLETRQAELEDALRGYETTHTAALAQFNVKKGMLESLGPWEADLNRLTHDRDAVQATYTMLSDRLRDLEIRKGARMQTARPIQRAAVPVQPIGSGKTKNILLSVILALLLATGTVFLQEYLDDRVHEADQLERFTILPVLAHVPLMTMGQSRLVADLPAQSHVAEAYRALRTGIGFASIDAQIRRLLISSPAKGDGKTTTAINLATAMAQDGKMVILVDAALRSPAVHRALRLSETPGLSEVLAGLASLDAAIQPSAIENLRVISGGSIPPNPAELLGSAAFDAVLEQLDERAQVVIVDSSPCTAVTDPLIIAGRMDGVLLVLRVGQTRKAGVQQTLEQLGRARARIIGWVANQVRANGNGYYYYQSSHAHAADTPPWGGRAIRNGRDSKPALEPKRSVAVRSRDDNGEA